MGSPFDNKTCLGRVPQRSPEAHTQRGRRYGLYEPFGSLPGPISRHFGPNLDQNPGLQGLPGSQGSKIPLKNKNPPAPGCGNSGKGGASRIRDRGTHGYRGRMGSPNMIWTHGYRGWTQFFGADLARWVPKSMDATQNQKSGGLQISGNNSNIRDI